jgi:hypothetical protein
LIYFMELVLGGDRPVVGDSLLAERAEGRDRT